MNIYDAYTKNCVPDIKRCPSRSFKKILCSVQKNVLASLILINSVIILQIFHQTKNKLKSNPKKT